MIFGKLEDLHIYKALSDNMSKAVDFVLNFKEEMEDGKYEIDGKNVYAMVSTSKTKEHSEPIFEAHRKYIDLQFIVRGEEDTGYAPANDLKVTTPYVEADDYLLAEGKGSKVRVSAGEFYIAYPCDGHLPGRSENPGEIRKVVVKVLV